jgi:hypothetical protein
MLPRASIRFAPPPAKRPDTTSARGASTGGGTIVRAGSTACPLSSAPTASAALAGPARKAHSVAADRTRKTGRRMMPTPRFVRPARR